MKKIVLFVLFFVCYCGSLTAGTLGDVNGDGKVDLTEAVYSLQVTAGMKPVIPDESPVFVDEQGKIGIGTAAPSANLDVKGNFSQALIGYIGVPKGSKSVAGVGTLFTEELTVGDGVVIEGEAFTVSQIVSNTQLVLDSPHTKGTSNAAIYKDTNLFSVKNGAGVEKLTIDKSGNVGIGTENPGAKLDVNGEFIRKIARATGLGPNDQTDSGQIESRVLKFDKIKDDTTVRIGWTDNLRMLFPADATNTACRWEIRVDGVSCPAGALIYDYYSAHNIHRPQQVVGYCGGISSGEHEIQIWVGKVPDYELADCYTGWYNSRWTIEAEEVY